MKKNAVELKLPSARGQVEVSGKKIWLWIDSWSPVTIFSMTDLKALLDKANLHLQPIREVFLYYSNNQIHILGKMAVTIALNGWVTQAIVSVIEGNHHSILGRDLTGTVGLELVQTGRVLGITGEDSSGSAGGPNELQ